MLMPNGGGDGNVGRSGAGWCGRWECVKISATIAAKHHASRPRILDKKAKSVKFDGAIIVTGELTDREKIVH
jgi:hypothetical protein